MVKRFLKYRIGFLIVLVFIALTAQAKDVGDLYKVNLRAKSQKEAVKHKLIQQGLKHVLTRVSGQPQLVENHASVKQAINNAEHYVQSFYFTRSEQNDQTDKPLKLHVTYQSQPIQQLLKKHDLPVWGQDRPLVLLWVINDNDDPRVLTNTHSNRVLTALSKQARALSLPVVFPLMDVLDVSRITTRQLLGGNRQAIQQASHRYDPNAIVIVDFQKRAGRVLSHWQLYFANHTYDWQREDPNKQVMSHKGIQQLTSRLAKHSAAMDSNNQPHQFNVVLHGLDQLKGIAQAQRILKDVAGVQSVHLSQLNGSSGIYHVTINTKLSSFVQKLDFSEHLRYNKTIHKNDQQWVVAQLI